MCRNAILNCWRAVLLRCALCAIAAGTARAELSSRFDLSNEATWIHNHILLAEVASVRHVEALYGRVFQQIAHVTVTLKERFTPDQPSFQAQDGSTVTFGGTALAFPRVRRHEQPPTLTAGEPLILISPRHGKEVAYVIQPGVRGVPADVATSLRAIRRLRLPDATDAQFVNAALQRCPVLARYAMRRLLAADTLPPQPEFVPQLRAVRDAQHTSIAVALLASRLLSRISGQPPLSRDEYLWLKARLVHTDPLDTYALTRLLNRMVAYTDRRAETIGFLLVCSRDSTIPDQVRIACADALVMHLFEYQHPDAHSESILDTLVELLQDDRRAVRLGTARALAMAAYYVLDWAERKSEERPEVDIIKSALQAAVERETDLGAWRSMMLVLERMDVYAEWHRVFQQRRHFRNGGRDPGGSGIFPPAFAYSSSSVARRPAV